MLRRKVPSSSNSGGRSTLTRFVRLISPKNSDVTKGGPATDEKLAERDDKGNVIASSDTSSCSDEANDKKRVSFAASPDRAQQKIFWNHAPVVETEENDQLLIFEEGDDDDNCEDDVFEDDDEEDYDLDDLSEIISVSTANTLASLSKLDEEEKIEKLGTIGTGKMFFFLKKETMLPGGLSGGIGSVAITTNPEPVKEELGAEELFTNGQILYNVGEDLLAAGKVKKARKTLSKAKRVQKRAISLLAKRMANSLYQQARKLSIDGENAHLATVLFGCCEMLKKNPIPKHILMAIKVHLKCRNNNFNSKACQTDLDNTVRELGNQAKLMALTMKAHALAVNLANERKRKKNKKKREQRQPETILEES